ncbi:hypothetical protein [Mucilaginibacter sp.]|uniref:hypothetical protein n=1 Tax=Mucilaginibacter sp. TaxID=1882438 RepID=UPI0028416753|nr:hypothetical protein [Mucilaginibacter sp.]MDR3693266.1 hypothetical protein [Mucilaginibacter sp.]
MKTKFLIPLAGLALLCACKGKSGSAESADTTKEVMNEAKVIFIAILFKITLKW